MIYRFEYNGLCTFPTLLHFYYGCEIKRSHSTVSNGTIRKIIMYIEANPSAAIISMSASKEARLTWKWKKKTKKKWRKKEKRIIMYVSINNPVAPTIDFDNRYDNSNTSSVDTTSKQWREANFVILSVQKKGTSTTTWDDMKGASDENFAATAIP